MEQKCSRNSWWEAGAKAAGQWAHCLELDRGDQELYAYMVGNGDQTPPVQGMEQTKAQTGFPSQ